MNYPAASNGVSIASIIISSAFGGLNKMIRKDYIRMKSKKILIFDFDGVIADSIHESFMTAVNTYIQMVPDHSLPVSSPLKADRLFEFEKKQREIFQRFEQFMPLSSSAGDYYGVFQMMEHHDLNKIKNQTHFTQYTMSINEKKREHYNKLFYKNRAILQKKDTEGWAHLIPPFPGIVEAIATLSERFTLCIATSKDRPSVDILLKYYGLNDYFDAENILDKDFAHSKREYIIRFHENLHVPYHHIHFIDDKVLHLLSVKDLGIHAYLALWGYNNKREHKTAQKEGFILLQLENLKNINNS